MRLKSSGSVTESDRSMSSNAPSSVGSDPKNAMYLARRSSIVIIQTPFNDSAHAIASIPAYPRRIVADSRETQDWVHLARIGRVAFLDQAYQHHDTSYWPQKVDHVHLGRYGEV
jgi:hypothetical protein